MKDDKSTRLAQIMDLFGVKGKDLAHYVHVDNSLVSKWKSNKRKLYPNSNTLNKIVEFFMLLDSSTKYQGIKKILKSTFPEADLSSNDTIKLLFKKWLTEYPETNQSYPLVPVYNKHKYTTKFEVFKDVNGRLQAEFRIMDLILSLPGTHELMVLDYGDVSWQNKDNSLFQLWKKNYREILARGHRVTVVNFIDREVHSLIDILVKIMPWALTGNVANFYPSIFSTTLFKPNLVIIKNKAALVGMSAEGFVDKPFVHFYTDLPTIQHCQHLFEAALSMCRPLYEGSGIEERHKFSDALKDMEKYSGDTYISTNMPFFNTLPEELLIKILIDNDFTNEEVDDCLSFYKEYNELFKRRITQSCYRYIFNIELLRDALSSEEIVYNEFEMITGKSVKISKDHFRNQLESLISFSDKQPNFQIALYSRNTDNKLEGINIWSKENIVTIANKLMLGDNEKPYSLYTKETTVNHAYFRYFTELWHSIPRADRDKEHVKNKLRQLLSSV